SNFDPYAAAGNAKFKASSLSFTGVASGGNGLTLDLVGKNAYPIISGIEISVPTPQGSAAPKANIDLSLDNGAHWTTIASNVLIDSRGRGSFLWTPTDTSDQALIRVRDVNSPATDVSDAAFIIDSSGVDYYINDGSTTGDVFTTAIGVDTNSGKTPAKPMRTLAALLGAYDLGPGDVIHIDTGT